jgi:hypothetical protein
MRKLLLLSCRAFPPDHRARQSDEVVDTALLAADGSAWRTVSEAASLAVAGLRQRLRAESHRPLRDGFALLAWVLALVNLALALAGTISARPPILPLTWRVVPLYAYRPDWWWIAFTIAAAGVALGLLRCDRRLAVGAALVNLGLLTFIAIYVPNRCPCVLDLIGYGPSFPGGRQWFAWAVVLVLATAAAPLRRLPLRRVLLGVVVVTLLVVLAEETSGHFLFLRWPLAAVLVLTIAFGALVPRLAVLAVGAALAAAGSGLLIRTELPHPYVFGFAAAWPLLVPFARLVRRRLA